MALLESDLVGIAVLLGLPDDTPADRVATEAALWAELDRENRTRLASLDRAAILIPDPQLRAAVRADIDRSEAAFESGDLPDAAQQLAQLEALTRASPVAESFRLDAILAQAGLARQQRDFTTAARLLQDAEQLLSPDSDAALLAIRMDRALVAYEQGYYQGDNAALRVAINLYRNEILPLVSRAQDQSEWSRAQIGFADALALLGTREGGATRLAEAVAAYREVLARISQTDNVEVWGSTHIGLGKALIALGERGSGTAEYVEARNAFDVVLRALDPDIFPLEWASAQHHLGIAVFYMGERTNEPRYFDGAIRHFELALSKRQRETTPVDWAESMSGIAVSELAIAVSRSQANLFDRAVATQQLVVESLPRQDFPLMWATAQINLGSAHLSIALARRDQGSLRSAISCYRSGLEEIERERDSLTWGTVNANLGFALVRLGEWQRDLDLVNQGVSAMMLAREERTLSQSPSDWASTTVVLALSLHTRGQLSGDFALFLSMREEVAQAGRIFQENGNTDYGQMVSTLDELFGTTRQLGGNSNKSPIQPKP